MTKITPLTHDEITEIAKSYIRVYFNILEEHGYNVRSAMLDAYRAGYRMGAMECDNEVQPTYVTKEDQFAFAQRAEDLLVVANKVIVNFLTLPDNSMAASLEAIDLIEDSILDSIRVLRGSAMTQLK